MKESSILCRRHVYIPDPICPFPVENGEFISNEKGEREFVKREPVAFSIASDYDVISNSMRNRLARTSPVRENIDPVDLFIAHPELTNL